MKRTENYPSKRNPEGVSTAMAYMLGPIVVLAIALGLGLVARTNKQVEQNTHCNSDTVFTECDTTHVEIKQ